VVFFFLIGDWLVDELRNVVLLLHESNHVSLVLAKHDKLLLRQELIDEIFRINVGSQDIHDIKSFGNFLLVDFKMC
jgi:hypothetical protein